VEWLKRERDSSYDGVLFQVVEGTCDGVSRTPKVSRVLREAATSKDERGRSQFGRFIQPSPCVSERLGLGVECGCHAEPARTKAGDTKPEVTDDPRDNRDPHRHDGLTPQTDTVDSRT
jgi:hypothetical protein